MVPLKRNPKVEVKIKVTKTKKIAERIHNLQKKNVGFKVFKKSPTELSTRKSGFWYRLLIEKDTIDVKITNIPFAIEVNEAKMILKDSILKTRRCIFQTKEIRMDGQFKSKFNINQVQTFLREKGHQCYVDEKKLIIPRCGGALLLSGSGQITTLGINHYLHLTNHFTGLASLLQSFNAAKKRRFKIHN